MLNWADQFNICCFLDNHQYRIEPHSYECLVGAGTLMQLSADSGSALEQFERFVDNAGDWCFGHLGYDLKNEIENLFSRHPDHIQFPDLFFFVPEVLLLLSETELKVGVTDDSHFCVFESIRKISTDVVRAENNVTIHNRVSREDYVEIIEKLKSHILRGDCYEINFCQEFYCPDATIDPLQVYMSLGNLSPNPFSCYYKINDKYLLCASPERFLKKIGTKILSQPIKGTWARDTGDPILDEYNRQKLLQSQKDLSENVMVVDLVRNDLSRVCKYGSVRAEELFGIYSFPQVHQMISTVSGELKDNLQIRELIKASFPMGSMTGAPKKRVMELIEEFESTKRGLFSGALGYISPSGDFDFNVVIRSVLYNASLNYLSYQAGSGITFYSDPLLEYEECLLKARAIKKVLGRSPARHKNLS